MAAAPVQHTLQVFAPKDSQTSEQPRACFISRHVMAAPLQHKHIAGGWSWGGKHSPPECRQAETKHALRVRLRLSHRL